MFAWGAGNDARQDCSEDRANGANLQVRTIVLAAQRHSLFLADGPPAANAAVGPGKAHAQLESYLW